MPETIMTATQAVAYYQNDKTSLKGKKLVLTVPCLSAIPSKDSISLGLYLAKVQQIIWQEDITGKRQKSDPFVIIAIRYIIDRVCRSYIYSNHLKKIKPLLQQQTTPLKNKLHTGLYIRSDNIFNLTSGGAVTHSLGVIESLNNFINDIQIIWSDPLPIENDAMKQDIVKPNYQLGRNIPDLQTLCYNYQLYAYLTKKNRKPDFIYSRYAIGQYAAALYAHFYRIPYILEYNGSEVWIKNTWSETAFVNSKADALLLKIEQANLQSASLIVVVSAVLKEEVVKIGIDEEKVLILPNAVDANKISPALYDKQIKEQLGFAEDDVVIGFIGSFGVWHGVECLIDAFNLIEKQHPSVQLLLIGDGERMPYVKDKIKLYNLSQRIILTGKTSQAMGVRYLAICDILASPHMLAKGEASFFGSPTKIFEYMALEKPIVAANLGQIGDVLEHSKTAYLTESGDPNSFADGLKYMLNNTDKALQMAKNARHDAENKHTWDIRIQTMLHKLSSLNNQF